MSGMTPPDGFSVERLFNFPSRYIDSIPSAERGKYLLRGEAVGALALNVAYGVNRVNPRDDLYMHVAVDPGNSAHEYAAQHAEQFGRGGAYPGHLTFAELEQLAEMTGRSGFHPLPGIVIGFPRDRYENRLVPHPRSWQLVLHEEVPFQGIDPHSQAALSELLGVDVGSLSPTPGATRPIREDVIHRF